MKKLIIAIIIFAGIVFVGTILIVRHSVAERDRKAMEKAQQDIEEMQKLNAIEKPCVMPLCNPEAKI